MRGEIEYKPELIGYGGVSIGVKEALLLHWSTFQFFFFCIQCHIHLAILDVAISQLLVELPRTVKDQKGGKI